MEAHKPTILKGGRVVDPGRNIDAEMDVLLEDGKISAVDKPGSFSGKKEALAIDVEKQLIVPGLMDIHVHLREPGFEWKETVQSGARTAVAGGYTRICCMPNTNPPNDTRQVTEFIIDQARQGQSCRVLPIGAISKGLEGKALSPMIELREAGCVAFSDDGYPVYDAGLMRRALEYSKMLGAVLCCHEEEKSLCHGFSMNESALSLKLGLVGMPGAAEDVMIARDIELVRLTKGRAHFCHVTTARAVTLIRRAKEDGIAVTGEVSPHHFTLDESAVGEFDTRAKMSPPLRSVEDRDAVLAGLAEGVLDCIACDHAPHEADSKNKEFQAASFGIIGLQTNVPLTLEKVRRGELTLKRAIEALAISPAKCVNQKPNAIASGCPGDITVIDPNRSFTLTEKTNCSKSHNSPFLGREMKGVAVRTFVGGREVYNIDAT